MKPTQRVYWYRHDPIDLHFKSSKEHFYVDETSIYRFSGKGNYLILHIKKQNLSTWDLIDLLSEACQIPKNTIGYAGLKDKYATTTQYISIPKRHERDIKAFSDKRITILKQWYHHSSLRIGDLVSNRFTIILEKHSPITAGKLEKVFRKISQEGLPNYFGYQRFGSSYESIAEGKAVVEDDKPVKDKRLKKFFINAYSSHLFNAWLAKRVALSDPKQTIPHPFTLLEGDVFMNLKNSKLFIPSKRFSVVQSFLNKEVLPTGLIAGRNVLRAEKEAAQIESAFDDIAFYNQGHRRLALIYPQETHFKYDASKQIITLQFTLPKGSYATVLLEALGNQELV